MKLGVTGGIGSGKTTVCKIFSILGVPVFSADETARTIMESDMVVAEAVKRAVGTDVYKDGILERRKLAAIVFNNPDLLKRINTIVHPAVFQEFTKWEKKQQFPYVIMEAAILFESGADMMVDKVLTVIAPENERIRRVARRNNLTEKEIIERIRNQHSDYFRVERSDFVVDNSGNILVIPQVLRIHEEMLFLSKTRH